MGVILPSTPLRDSYPLIRSPVWRWLGPDAVDRAGVRHGSCTPSSLQQPRRTPASPFCSLRQRTTNRREYVSSRDRSDQAYKQCIAEYQTSYTKRKEIEESMCPAAILRIGHTSTKTSSLRLQHRAKHPTPFPMCISSASSHHSGLRSVAEGNVRVP
jgi:murein L,D-transpeptidase YcbB/YkuD